MSMAIDTAETMSNFRTLVWEIRDLYRELPDTIAQIAGLHGVSSERVGSPSTDTVRIVGGDALTMHAGGTDNGVKSSRGGNREHAQDNLPSDAPSVFAVLTRIEDGWRQMLGDPAAMTTNVNAAVEYLIANAARAVNNLDIASDLADLASLRGRLLNVTGRTNTPKPSDAPCIDCNGSIVQRYLTGPRPATNGLDDVRECSRCGKTYTPFQYQAAIETRLETVRQDPERLFTAAEARTAWRLSEKQLYVWEGRTDRTTGLPKITPVGVDASGRRLYRNGDIAALKTGYAA